MPKYVLHYFNARGRAEIARMLFAAAGVEYTDNRYNMEEWLKLKPEMNMGQLPVLDIDGKRLGQSGAINSYLAREFGLYGKDSFHTARIDEISGCLDDIVKLLMKIVFEKDSDAKEKLRIEMENGQLPEWMAKFELLLKLYHTEFESTSEVTLAEIAIHNFMGLIMKFFPNITIPPQMKKCADKVEANENLKKWIERRPQTDM